MSGRILGTILLAAAIPGAWAPPRRAAEFFVSPTGDDSAAGSREKPFATLARARDAVRASGRAGKEPVTVTVMAGTYYLPETLVFTGEDSGSKDAPVVYRAAPGGKAVLSGGSRLILAWSPFKDSILKAKTAAGLAIDQVFVEGRRQPMARYPNYDPNILPYNGFAAEAFSRERAARWADPAGGYIHAMHSAHWGGYHYRITGKNGQGEVTYEGGWQNNRPMGMHKSHRFVENIFEELDAPGEWFHDAKTGTLYHIPAPGVDLRSATVEVVRLRHLVEFNGTKANPVRHVTLQGFTFRHAARTFMDTREPLLRSDWTIYRGGAIVFRGAEDCAILDGELDQPGGNGVFVSGYNRRIAVRGTHIHGAGASGVCFVGDPASVRNPLFEYNHRQDFASIDKTPGPRTDDYPAECAVEDGLIHSVGVVEKQAAGVQVSMARGITIRHCSIYDVGRAGINFSEGTFGGHVIDSCDVFDTVKETGDHGSFNSWGRDRYWGLKGAPADELPRLALLDTERTVIQNSRWRCDHGWDVDLDDGSSNYEIVNNLFLRGGLKLREGFHRTVRNNIAVNNSLHPHVWYDQSGDVVTGNIWMGAYRPAGGMPKGRWGKEIDRNLFATSEGDRAKFAANGCDANSLVGDPMFVNPAMGDFRVKDGSPALKLGFQNFPMDQFGVRKPELKKIARTPEIPLLKGAAPEAAPTGRKGTRPQALWQQARVKNLEGEEYSAFGVSRESGGVHLVDVPAGSLAARAGFRNDDLIQGAGGQPVRRIADLVRLQNAAGGKPLTVEFVRQQQRQKLTMEGYVFATVETSPDSAFKTLPLWPADRTVPIKGIATQPETHNEPPPTLHDGQLASTYGPVFGNGDFSGLYKVDLGEIRAISSIGTWSFNQNGNRGAQAFTLYGSAAAGDPGWNVGDSKAFTPIAEVHTAEAGAGKFHASSVRHSRGESLGSFRWLVWAAHPLNSTGEHSAYQELQVLPAGQ